MKVTAYEVEITKGEFKGVKGFCFQTYSLVCPLGTYPYIVVYDKEGNEYIVRENEIKVTGSFEYDIKGSKGEAE